MSTLKINDHGLEIRKYQLLLNAHLHPSPKLTPDGLFGHATQQAVIAFQQQESLALDGQIGPKTRAALGLMRPPRAAGVVVARSASWMDIAVAELGIHEDSVQGQQNSRILEYHQTTTLKATDDETPWCASFVNWVLRQSGRRGTNSAAAKSWLDWGAAVAVPAMGVVVVIKKSTSGVTQGTGSSSGFHVGFFISMSALHIRILGGNQGDQVKYSDFSLASYEVKGYRRPL